VSRPRGPGITLAGLTGTSGAAYTESVVDFSHAARVIASQCACVRVRRASRALTRLYDVSLRAAGLHATQLTMLAAVATCGERGAPMGALADGLVMDRTTLTRNLVPLEKAGLLRVARDPEDARARIIFLTREGERAIEAAFPIWEQTQQHVREKLGPKEVDALREELGRLIAMATAPAEAQAPARPPRRKPPAKAPAPARSTKAAAPARPKKRKAT